MLGPLCLEVGGVEVPVPGPKRRALALLAMVSPRSMSATASSWPYGPTSCGLGSAALQSHVSRLPPSRNRRRVWKISPVTGSVSTPGLDADQFTARTGRQTASGDAAAGLDLVRRARRLRRGEPLEEFADVEALAGWRRSLDEQRLAAADLHAELAMATGNLSEAVEIAGATVSEDGLRETSVLLFMQALAGSGRAVEALRAGHAYRQLLAEETRNLRRANGLYTTSPAAMGQEGLTGRPRKPGYLPIDADRS